MTSTDTTAFKLSARSLSNLQGVHPDLVRVVHRAIAITDVDFAVIEGVRSIEQQKRNVARGASQTMNSRHLKAANGYGHAVDIVPMDGGEVSWDWPLYHRLAPVIKDAARLESVPVEWGGDWKGFKDGPHWQLPWTRYPAGAAVVASEPRMAPRREDELSRSRTVGGAGAAAAGGAAVLAEPVQEVVNSVQSQQWALSSGDWTAIAIGGLIVAGAVYALYARWDDAGRPTPWGR